MVDKFYYIHNGLQVIFICNHKLSNDCAEMVTIQNYQNIQELIDNGYEIVNY